MKSVPFFLRVMWALAFVAGSGQLHALSDLKPPIVLSVKPVDGEILVSPHTEIILVLSDPYISPYIPGSGVDVDSVSVRLNGEHFNHEWKKIDDSSVLIRIAKHRPFPPVSCISIDVEARDITGNRMEPFHSIFITEALDKDDVAPRIVDISPPDGCMFVTPTAQIAFRLYDSESGVDINTLRFFINDRLVSPQICPEQEGYYCYFVPDSPFPFATWISCGIIIEDFCQNTSIYEWTFQTKPPPVSSPVLLSPENGALLNFQLEKGVITFIWTYKTGDSCFRLRLSVENSHAYQNLDVGPGDYESLGDRVELKYFIPEYAWNEIVKMGRVRWSVAKIEGYGGSEVSPYSDVFKFSLAPSRAVVLRSPPDKSITFTQSGSPVFSWDPYDKADVYYFGIMQVGSYGELVGDVSIFEVECELHSYRFDDVDWLKLANGKYVWTVMAQLPDGTHSECMNYEFMKYGFTYAGIMGMEVGSSGR